MRWAALLLAALVVGAPAGAQQLVVSEGPERVSVTIYRAPGRTPDDAIDRRNPDGYALITETRTVRIPAGPATIRFEGVAGGIFSESAIVAGLPDGVREKNLDADLLSPRTLYDRALGRRVWLRRTNPATGRVIEEQGVIRSSKNGGMLLSTAAGVEAVHCSGLPEAVVYDSVPAGLTPKPTLSVAVESTAGANVTLTLSYLAGGFDWQANYVATMRPDGRSADLFAWLTLASSDVTSFADAGTQVIAGKPNRESSFPSDGQFSGGRKDYRCWRTGAPLMRSREPVPPPPPPPPPMMAAPAMERAMVNDLVVTGSRIARQEELGDFKLYRVPQPVTVAAKAQKQVALIDKPAVPLRVVYVSRGDAGQVGDPVLVLRAKNRVTDGLGLALPAGPVAVFQPVGTRDVLVGEGAIDDKAVGEDVEVKLDETPSVKVESKQHEDGKGKTRVAAVVTNANPWPVTYEAEFERMDDVRLSFGGRTFQRDGKTVWTATVPANGTVTLTYRVRRRD